MSTTILILRSYIHYLCSVPWKICYFESNRDELWEICSNLLTLFLWDEYVFRFEYFSQEGDGALTVLNERQTFVHPITAKNNSWRKQPCSCSYQCVVTSQLKVAVQPYFLSSCLQTLLLEIMFFVSLAQNNSNWRGSILDVVWN